MRQGHCTSTGKDPHPPPQTSSKGGGTQQSRLGQREPWCQWRRNSQVWQAGGVPGAEVRKQALEVKQQREQQPDSKAAIKPWVPGMGRDPHPPGPLSSARRRKRARARGGRWEGKVKRGSGRVSDTRGCGRKITESEKELWIIRIRWWTSRINRGCEKLKLSQLWQRLEFYDLLWVQTQERKHTNPIKAGSKRGNKDMKRIRNIKILLRFENCIGIKNAVKIIHRN